MAESEGFWSYVHADDEAEGGRISQLARDVGQQFQMLTGESLSLFLDKDALKWGENWRDKIDSNLARVAFFIPVMTPRYFLSPECRRELQFFARRATQLGIKELVLPLLYVDVQALHDGASNDDLIELVRTFQWEDWRDLRLAEVRSEAYRRGVARLATRLVEANRLAEATIIDATTEIQGILEGDIDDAPGLIDRIAQAEEILPQWTETMGEISSCINLINQLMGQAVEDLKRVPGASFKSRVAIARRLARELSKPIEGLWKAANKFTTELHDVDDGFRAIIEKAPSEIQGESTSRTNFCAFFEMVRTLSANAHAGLTSLQGMVDAISPIENLSRDLRPVLRRLRQGLTIMVEAREVTDEWVGLIDGTGIECTDSGVSMS